MAWGYLADQKDDICKPIAEAGANLYLCPGVCGWNVFLNILDTSYSNVKIMCEYAKTYNAVGILNTEWGDFGHINDISFSTPGIIYGGIFSWNLDAYSEENGITEEEVNKAISSIEYRDITENYVNLLKNAAIQQIYDWWAAVIVHEGVMGDGSFDKNKSSLHAINAEINSRFMKIRQDLERTDEITDKLYQIRKDLRKSAFYMDSIDKSEFIKADNAIIGIDIWNRVGRVVVLPESLSDDERKLLAEELETWFMRYKEIYRADSKESMLNRVTKVVFWYADKLRGM